MAEDVEVKVKSAYKENDNHVPNPTDLRGYSDTTDTGGAEAGDIRRISHVFDLTDAQAVQTAKAALDPDDPTDESLVTLPGEGSKKDLDEQRESARKRIEAKAKDGEIEVGAHTAGQKQAAEENKDVSRKSGKASRKK
jgi:hypothetical protein